MRLIERYEEYLEARAYNNKTVLFGASLAGMKFIEEYRFYNDVDYFCDNDEKKWNGKLMGKDIFPPSKLLEDINNVVVIISSMYYEEIYKQLKDMGVPHIYEMKIFEFSKLHTNGGLYSTERSSMYSKSIWLQGYGYTEPIKAINNNKEKIDKVRSMLSDNESVRLYDIFLKKRKYCYCDYSEIQDEGTQYFDLDILNFSEREVFADIGCYDGMTAAEFARTVNGNFEKIYSFEACEFFFARCIHTLSCDKKIDGKFEFIPLGASNKNGTVNMSPRLQALDDNGDLKIDVCKLDDKLGSAGVSFIKIDIEGGELNALEGAQNIIRTNKPKLAVSIYHKVEDLWIIPLYIKQLVPEYKLYVRHYTRGLAEFVLYATV